jgi:hypothetical protein
LGRGQDAPRRRRPSYYAGFAAAELVAVSLGVMFFLDAAGLL